MSDREPKTARCSRLHLLVLAVAVPVLLPGRPARSQTKLPPTPAGPIAGVPVNPQLTILYGDPNRAAVLFFPGLGETSIGWTNPRMESSYPYFTDTPPGNSDKGSHDTPGVGIYGVALSDNPAIVSPTPSAGTDDSWFNYLWKQGYTVATFEQRGRTFDDALPYALEAYAEFLKDTAAHNPSAPPPVALLGHSRGGLLIRRILKDKGSMGRVRWAITLHSPHAGSDLARAPAEFGAQITQLLTLTPNEISGRPFVGSLKIEAHDLAVEALRPLNDLLLDPGQTELVTDGPLIRSLASGESPLPGVLYFTFGGTKPTLFRIYSLFFNSGSVIPQYKYHNFSIEQYFHWGTYPVEVPLISPLLDRLPPFTPEIVSGKGDGVVTNESAKLPWSFHQSWPLNHFEVMWNRGLQQEVANILAAPIMLAPLQISPIAVSLMGGQSQRFTLTPDVPVTWSVINPVPGGQLGDPSSPARAALKVEIDAYQAMLDDYDKKIHAAGGRLQQGILAQKAAFVLAKQARIADVRGQIEAIDSTYVAPAQPCCGAQVLIEAVAADGRSAAATVTIVPAPAVVLEAGVIAAGEGHGVAGGVAPVSIDADSAVADLSAIDLSLSFDPSLGLFQSDVTAGPLFAAPAIRFSLSAPGRAVLGLTAATAVRGPGTLARLNFHVPPDAKPGASYPILVLADQSAATIGGGSPTGLTFRSGSVTVVGGAKGDVNGDGSITLADVTLALEFSVGTAQPTAEQQARSDANDDGLVNLQDATVLLRRVVGI